jgi:hypothetical protein
MKPKIVIITTPNREYNVLFENFEGPFRHWDHKFEWTRSEFQNWVQTCIIDKYPDYIVERFDGLGKDLFRNGRNAQLSRILMVVCVFGLTSNVLPFHFVFCSSQNSNVDNFFPDLDNPFKLLSKIPRTIPKSNYYLPNLNENASLRMSKLRTRSTLIFSF